MQTDHLSKTTITSFVATFLTLTLLVATIPFAFAPDTHNLAIVSVEPALTLVAPGGSVNVNVTIENQGTVPMNQTTQLQLFYRVYENGTEGTGDDDPWGTWFAQIGYVAILNAGENASYASTWNVPSWLTPGDYQIRAAFPYSWVDDDPSDNTLLSDKVTVAVHNLAIVSVEPALTLVAPGGSVNVNVTIENQGTVPMNQTTQLQLFYRVYENGTEGTGDDDPWGTWFAQIGYVAILNAGENASYASTWNVPSWLTPGDYQIRAAFPYSWVDDDPSDNTLLSDKVTVAAAGITGDINNDGIVDIMDVVIAALAFGSRPGNPNWNPEADLMADGLIDIVDLVIIGVNFGRTA